MTRFIMIHPIFCFKGMNLEGLNEKNLVCFTSIRWFSYPVHWQGLYIISQRWEFLYEPNIMDLSPGWFKGCSNTPLEHPLSNLYQKTRDLFHDWFKGLQRVCDIGGVLKQPLADHGCGFSTLRWEPSPHWKMSLWMSGVHEGPPFSWAVTSWNPGYFLYIGHVAQL